MTELSVEHLHRDIVTLKKDVAVIKHILSEEGELTDEAKRRLEEARKTPSDEYARLE